MYQNNLDQFCFTMPKQFYCHLILRSARPKSKTPKETEKKQHYSLYNDIVMTLYNVM